MPTPACALSCRAPPRLLRLSASSLALLAAILACLATAPAVRADEPLAPPADYAQTTPNGLFEVRGQIEPPLTSISSIGDVALPMWFIDRYARHVLVAENGASALVLPEGGNLLDFNEPGFALLSFHRPSGQDVTILLGDVMDPATLVPTASHFLWMTSAAARGGEFIITLVNGGEVRIDAATGAVLASPVGATSATNEAIVGVVPPGGTQAGGTGAGCLTWDAFRASLTVLGPKEPLPTLPAPFASGCVTGYADQGADFLFVLEEGLPAPVAGSELSPVLAARDPLYGLLPVAPELAGTEAPVGGLMVTVTLARSLGVGSTEFVLNEAWDAPTASDYGGATWRTVSVEGLPEAEALAALDSLRDHWVEGPRELATARERNDLLALPDGTHHLGAVPGGPGTYHMLVEKQDSRLRGVDYFWASGYVGCFDAMLDAGGGTGLGDAASIDEGSERGQWAVTRDTAFDFDGAGTLRPLPPLMAEEHRRGGELEAARDLCLAELDAG